MSDEMTSTREVPEGQSRKQILLREDVREYLRDLKREEGRTYSEQLEAMIPEDVDYVIANHPDEIVNIKPTPAAYERVMSVTGPRVSPGDVVAYLVMVELAKRGRMTAAAEVAMDIPDVLWDVLGEAFGEVSDDD